MKHVVNISELHKLVPETKKLEGINFKDMKALIETVIQRVEESGNWEYVQYIAGNPSLFVVKEKEYQASQESSISSYDKYMQETYVQNDKAVTPKKTDKKNNPEPVKEEQKSQPLYEPIPIREGANTLFPETKMPWS